MNTFARLMAICLFAFAATALPDSSVCLTVREVKSNPGDFLGRSIKIKAFLGYTGHGFYLVDEPKQSEVLRVTFPRTGPFAEAAEEVRGLVFRCGFANKWMPVGGVYEGELSRTAASASLLFEIHSKPGDTPGGCSEKMPATAL